MTTVQEQYTETVKQGQEAVTGAVEGWTRAVRDAWGQFPATDPNEAIDQFYGTAGRLLDVQRDLVKGLVNAAGTFADTLRTETRKVTEAAHPEG